MSETEIIYVSVYVIVFSPIDLSGIALSYYILFYSYRGFPVINQINREQILAERKYTCNFVGTVYENSSREALVTHLKELSSRTSCYISPRKK